MEISDNKYFTDIALAKLGKRIVACNAQLYL